MGTQVAVKVIHQQVSCRHLEFHCPRVLNYPNIVKLFEVIETQKTLYLVMERVHRLDMHGYLTNHGHLNENKAQGIFRQLVSALEYCHQRGIVHWNLKPENVLLDSEVNLKLTGFGLNEEFIGQKPSMLCGNLSYAAQSSSGAITMTAPE